MAPCSVESEKKVRICPCQKLQYDLNDKPSDSPRTSSQLRAATNVVTCLSSEHPICVEMGIECLCPIHKNTTASNCWQYIEACVCQNVVACQSVSKVFQCMEV